MKKVWITMEPIPDKPGWSSPTGFHLVEPETWYSCYTVSDPEEFVAHMQRYNRLLLHNSLAREEYEKLCEENGVTPRADADLPSYGLKYGDFGMDQYHTNPANRQCGIASTIHQLRYLGIEREMESTPNVSPAIASIPKKEGQLWESCRCGNEPVFMPLHLCSKCWPSEAAK